MADRPPGEDLIGAVNGLDPEEVRGGLRELTATRLLADATAGGEQRPRHALLAEAVAADLLPSEKTAIHERLAQALQAASDDMLAELEQVWLALRRHHDVHVASTPRAPSTPFTVGVAIRPPPGVVPPLGYLVKGIIDGVVCAFQAHTDRSTVVEVATRLSNTSRRYPMKSRRTWCGKRGRRSALFRAYCTSAAPE